MWDAGHEVHQATYDIWDRNHVTGLLELVSIVSPWRLKAVYLDGKVARWDSTFRWAASYRKRAKSFLTALYCFGEVGMEFNLWGCRNVGVDFGISQDHGVRRHPSGFSIIRRPDRDRVRWLSFGSFDNQRTFYFNKRRIKRLVRQRLQPYRFCPSLSTDFVDEAIDRLPDSVNPIQDSSWQFIGSDRSDWWLLGDLSMPRGNLRTRLAEEDFEVDFDDDDGWDDFFLEDNQTGGLTLIHRMTEMVHIGKHSRKQEFEIRTPLTLIGVHPRSTHSAQMIFQNIHRLSPKYSQEESGH